MAQGAGADVREDRLARKNKAKAKQKTLSEPKDDIDFDPDTMMITSPLAGGKSAPGLAPQMKPSGLSPFEQAFAAARAGLGAGQQFPFEGRMYSTNRADDVAAAGGGMTAPAFGAGDAATRGIGRGGPAMAAAPAFAGGGPTWRQAINPIIDAAAAAAAAPQEPDLAAMAFPGMRVGPTKQAAAALGQPAVTPASFSTPRTPAGPDEREGPGPEEPEGTEPQTSARPSRVPTTSSANAMYTADPLGAVGEMSPNMMAAVFGIPAAALGAGALGYHAMRQPGMDPYATSMRPVPASAAPPPAHYGPQTMTAQSIGVDPLQDLKAARKTKGGMTTGEKAAADAIIAGNKKAAQSLLKAGKGITPEMMTTLKAALKALP